MNEWKAKRFWQEVRVCARSGGYAIELDKRIVKTPAKATLLVPTRVLADLIAAEWAAQTDEIDPNTMPATRSANAALDKVAHQHGEIADIIASYGATDLICHRAEAPEGLIARQNAAWNPLLEWAGATLGAHLTPVVGVMPARQNPAALGALAARVHGMDTFALTALHDLVSLSGSLIIGLAATEGLHPPEHLWHISRIDETWQEEMWGTDSEARNQAAGKKAAFLHAKRFYNLSRPSCVNEPHNDAALRP